MVHRESAEVGTVVERKGGQGDCSGNVEVDS